MFKKNYNIIDCEIILKEYWQINFMSKIETKPWVIITVFKEQINPLDIKKITPQSQNTIPRKISKIEEKYQFRWLNVDNAKIALITGFVIVVVLSVSLFIFR